MKILISAVGTTDPISNNHDAALLHIARNYRPDKIVLVYSQEMMVKQDLINKVLLSIEGYNPIIEIDSTILNNDEVFLFDKMYEVMGLIVQKYTNDDDEIILNLSSGTPQIISALFALNRINDYNTQAIQVATPKKGANREYKSLTDTEIDALIVENQDNNVDFVDRSIKDKSEKFTQALVKRHLRSLIASFDYQAAEAIINRKEYNKLLSKKRIAYIREKLNDFSRVFKNQSILSDILSFPLDDSQKKALNYYLLIDVLKEREHIADVLIKAKSLAEFVIEETIKKNHEGLIVFDGNLPKLNPDFPDCEAILDDIDKKMKKSRGIEDTEERIFSVQSTLNLLAYLNILEFYEYDSQLQTAINSILSLNGERNKVAHGLSEIDTRLLSRKKLKQLSDNLRLLLVDCLGIDSSYFNYYDKQNEELIKMLE
ncbi:MULTISPECIES: type III-A CRISPR-associated CARF protein Csm6 [Streptococcus]|uniref:type III-A CRISPR-associated CARF protein Csm6 n=1 Tax=Streptococcus TaxID=1301 RepID=UPI0004B0918A|nr:MULTISPECIES: type III-A CRISPR-associated CARF protein Csm6 [Streptococcus]MCA6656763.1 type III-A CRISPR-associated protein Csm6 [Streptococcus salivarius]MCA6658280.1 type III-A CRISPR-associated protein Csm6 [Streptococcus salivarius]